MFKPERKDLLTKSVMGVPIKAIKTNAQAAIYKLENKTTLFRPAFFAAYSAKSADENMLLKSFPP